MNSLKHVTRMAAHAAALIFGAFWLVATSAVPGPAADCFTGIGNPTRLEVALGSRTPASSAAKCAELDGLAENGTLLFDLSQGPRPESYGCYDYDTDALTGVDGVTLQSPVDPLVIPISQPLTSVGGTFASPELRDCTGNWSLMLYPQRSPASGQLVSPLAAGPDETWFVRRQIRIDRPSSCGGLFTETVRFTCSDEYVVASITELPRP